MIDERHIVTAAAHRQRAYTPACLARHISYLYFHFTGCHCYHYTGVSTWHFLPACFSFLISNIIHLADDADFTLIVYGNVSGLTYIFNMGMSDFACDIVTQINRSYFERKFVPWIMVCSSCVLRVPHVSALTFQTLLVIGATGKCHPQSLTTSIWLF